MRYARRSPQARGSTSSALTYPPPCLSSYSPEHRSAEDRIPALRLTGAVVRGPLELPGATVPALVELTSCTCDEPIDLYATDLAGWRLTRCTLPGLQAANVRISSELALQMCTVTGPVVLPDARIERPLRLIGTRLDTAGGHALVGIRLMVRGVLNAQELQTQGEVRSWPVPAVMRWKPPGCRSAETGASVAGNAVFSGATLQGSTDPDKCAVLVLPCGSTDPTATLVADRIAVNGNLMLDAGFTATGSVWITNAQLGGYLRLSGATLGSPVPLGADNGDQSRPVPVALAADGIEVRGDLEARRALPRAELSDDAGPLRTHGQVRLVGSQVHGSAA